jgi:hypothetical protein
MPLAVLTAVSLAAVIGCDVNTALQEVSDARRLSADIHVQFAKAADASNRAVMADTDDASAQFAKEAEQATAAIERDAGALAPILKQLGFTAETGLLETFEKRFAEYRAVDRKILDLAVENTNLKAQRLSFGDARDAADAMRDALDRLSPRDAAKDGWHVKALAATALASARDIEALQAPHIAEADDSSMSALEKRMAASEAAARGALRALTDLVQPSSRRDLAQAGAALDRLMAVNMQIVDLSRRNSNVRSLALSLTQKRAVTAQCEESLTALRDALAKRGFTSVR